MYAIMLDFGKIQSVALISELELSDMDDQKIKLHAPER